MKDIWKDGIWGVVVADALGVPVEFTSRDERMRDPVIGMREFGTHHQPMGTWSDDSSMVFATMDSIRSKGGIDYKDIMDKFAAWCHHADYTPHQDVFDIGGTTRQAIMKYGMGEDPIKSGCDSERDNGNGSLMRILPVCLYLYQRRKTVCTSDDESVYMIHNVSALTHAHLRSKIGCGIYFFMVEAVIGSEGDLIDRLQTGVDAAFMYYRHDSRNHTELEKYSRFIDLVELKQTSVDQIKSSGYVVDTLEAAVWCLITTDSYESAVLKAVNLGDDTDTVGAVAGGLAGLFYGFEGIPKAWIDVIQRKEWIKALIDGF